MSIIIPQCKHCRKGFFLGFGLNRHLKKEHGIELTANDKRHLRKVRFKFCLLPLFFLWWGIRWVLVFALLPFHLLYEILTNVR